MHPQRAADAPCSEGGYRVPQVIRWPGVIKADTFFTDVCKYRLASDVRGNCR